jgi:pimeloyl-ACP methyl ester carboxylesterase
MSRPGRGAGDDGLSESIEPFEIRVDDSILDDLHRRLTSTRLPDQIENTGWEYGIPLDYLGELIGYWRHTYDWRSEESRLNGFDHYRTTVDGQLIHFIHARSASPDALPLLLTHGWPGSVVEFLDVIPRLTDPESFGGQAGDAFHVIAPSLPGYGFSGPTRSRGWDPARIARAFVELMDRLGYRRYVAQGGDWGAQVTTRLGSLDPDHCVSIHLNMALGLRPETPGPLTEEEQADVAGMKQFADEESGYANEQGTKPQTLGVALNDSPAGLLAWMVEKFRAWSDCGGHPEPCFSRDQLITNAMLYWVTQTSTSSARLYWETKHSASAAPPFVEVPTGVARYPKEVLRWPRSWVERQYNVVHWAVMERGGHFAAMEQPDLFVDDLRQHFRRVR